MSPNPRIKYPLLLVKILHYEFWPFWVLYFPAIFYWFYNAIITRSLTYFTLANPGIDYGGVFGESKIDILKKIPLTYLPTTLFFEPQTTGSQIKEEMQRANLIFPVICKPDKGEMGFKVAKIENDDQLNTYLANSTDRIILQEFIEYEIELGVLYYRMPNDNHSGITSIVGKEFLQVVGDGCSSIRELINKTDRGRLQLKSLEYRLKDQFDKVLPNNHRMIVEPIGNHCRGTRFINRNDLITPELIKVFDQIATQFEGFYYGRFDLKV